MIFILGEVWKPNHTTPHLISPLNDQLQNFNDALLDALNAFNRDDYETAYKLFLPLAELR